MYRENDPFNPSPFNPSGTQNTAYYERLADEQRRRDEQERQNRQRQEYERQQAEMLRASQQYLQDQQRATADEQQRRLLEQYRAGEHVYRPNSFESSTGSTTVDRPANPLGGAVLCVLGTFLAMFYILVLVPFELGAATAGANPWWMLVKGLSTGVATATVLIVILVVRHRHQAHEERQTYVAGGAMLVLLAAVAATAMPRWLMMLSLLTYLIVVAITIAILIGGIVAMHREQAVCRPLLERWGWGAVLLLTVMCGAYLFGGFGGNTGLPNHPALQIVADAPLWPVRLGDWCAMNLAGRSFGAAAMNLLALLSLGTWWSACGWFLSSLLHPSRKAAKLTAAALAVAVLVAFVVGVIG